MLMPESHRQPKVQSGEDLAKRALRTSPGVFDVLRLYEAALKRLDMETLVEAASRPEILYRTSDSTES